jgi:hypothetical protein
MAYTILNTDGTTLLLLADGTANKTATSLTLIGKNYNGFGEQLNNNFVKLLANSANTSDTPPSSPLTGQLWYNTTTKRLMVYDTYFKSISGAIVSSNEPENLSNGDLWWDTTNGQLNVMSDNAVELIGPVFSKTIGDNGWVLPEVIVLDTDNDRHDVTLIRNYGKTLGYISSTQFSINTSTTYSYLTTGTAIATVRGLTILGDIQLTGDLYLGQNPPAHWNSTGTVGQFAFGTNYLYICTATNAWSRIQMSDTGSW